MKKSLKSKWFQDLLTKKFGPGTTWNEYNGRIWIFNASCYDEPLESYNSIEDGIRQLNNKQNVY